jgi:hypothetical protein
MDHDILLSCITYVLFFLLQKISKAHKKTKEMLNAMLQSHDKELKQL